MQQWFATCSYNLRTVTKWTYDEQPRMVARTTRIHHPSRIKVMQTILARMIISACCRRRCPLSWLPIHDVFVCFSILIHAKCSYRRCCSRRPLSSSRCGGELLHLVSFVTALVSTSILCCCTFVVPPVILIVDCCFTYTVFMSRGDYFPLPFTINIILNHIHC